MKRNSLIMIFSLLFVVSLGAQNVLQQRIKNSVEFREAAEKLGLEPGSAHIVTTSFIIDNTGLLEDISAESEYPELEQVALNILKGLPLSEAPKHASTKKNRIVLPMKFYVETETQKSYRLRKEARLQKIKGN